jgi:hypothetical protein
LGDKKQLANLVAVTVSSLEKFGSSDIYTKLMFPMGRQPSYPQAEQSMSKKGQAKMNKHFFTWVYVGLGI